VIVIVAGGFVAVGEAEAGGVWFRLQALKAIKRIARKTVKRFICTSFGTIEGEKEPISI
jgi:hypothetical protein